MRTIAFILILWLSLRALATCINVPLVEPPPEPPESTNEPVEIAAMMFPVEVLGAPDSTASISLYVTNGASAETLYLQIHGLTYEGKARARINAGTWVTLNDSNVTYPLLEQAHWGMGGVLSTLRLRYPTSGWTMSNGYNAFEFQFSDTNILTGQRDGKSIGFRVLSLNLEHDGTNLIAASQIVEDDPTFWVAPTGGDVEDGEWAWHNLEITEAGETLLVHCTDCHARDGRDLKYFNYSNNSIVQRSIFHGVPAATATNIAAYIRSIDIPYEQYARPWNPPYQPGPGMDSRPVRSWAAGAGLSAVLDHDTNSLADIFPSGITTNALDFTAGINVREIRLATQLPDWNHWLAQIHPNDAYPDVYPEDGFVQIYSTITNELNGLDAEAAAVYFENQKTHWDGENGYGEYPPPAKEDPTYPTWANKRKAIHHWRLVKTWEIMQEHAIEEMGDEVFAIDGADDRRWFHGEPFLAAPHKLGTPKYDSWHDESMQWYQLQLVLNNGNRHNPGLAPIDWAYQDPLNRSAWNNTPALAFYSIDLINIASGCIVGVNDEPLTSKGSWRINRTKIENIFSPPNNAQMSAIDATLRQQITGSMLWAFLDSAQRFTPSEYAAAGENNARNSNIVIFLVKKSAEIGVDANVTNRLLAFKNSIWP